jgi:UDP-glucuronate 4-epimerase
MSKILVTGGAGFIGSHTIKSLIEQGHDVVSVDDFNDYYSPQLKQDRIEKFLKDYDFPSFDLDIRNLEELKKLFKAYKFDKVCHLAARAGVRASLEDPFVYQSTNIQGTLNLLELSKDYGVNNFVYASSSSVYGNTKETPFREDMSVDRPISPYAATKKTCELLAHNYSHIYGLPTIGLRFFTVYGPWGRPDMAYFSFANKIKKGESIDVYNYGKDLKRDFTYVDDIVKGIVACLDKEYKYEIFNLGNNKPVELMEFINSLEKHLGIESKKNLLPMQPGDVMITYANIDKAKRFLGYEPTISIDAGLKNFVNWYKEYYV